MTFQISIYVTPYKEQTLEFDVDFSYCWLNLEVSWYSLEQYIWLYCRQAFNYCCSLLQVWNDTEMQVLIWGLKCLLGMLRCMLGSVKGVKSENPKEEVEIRKWKRGCYSKGYY